MNTPILDRLNKLKKDNSISFHTPGHKGKNTLINWGDYIPYIDTTEIFGMDNLHDPKGIIKDSQDLAAKAFGAIETIYSVNGTTGGIYIALGGITNPGDKVLIQRNSHRSIYNGIILNRLNPEYIYPNYNKKHRLLTGIDPEALEAKLRQDKDIKVVVLVYPNYYGICSNIERIAEIVHKYNRILLVDEAHGSHFIFSEKLPISALEAGADISIQSTHKTLPSFTQTSMVHVGTHRVDINKLKTISSLYQTTSPSYLFMLSLEIARAYMEREGSSRLDKTIDTIDKTIKALQNIERAYVFTGDKEDNTLYDRDITKILFGLQGVTGTRVNKVLSKDYNISLEMADYYYALALSTLMNEKEDFKRLVESVQYMAKRESYVKTEDINIRQITPKKVMPIYEAFYRNKKDINLRESIGKISASFITPYPPGVPIICPGEEISEELEEQIRFLLEKNIEIIGLIGYNKEKIEVVD